MATGSSLELGQANRARVYLYNMTQLRATLTRPALISPLSAQVGEWQQASLDLGSVRAGVAGLVAKSTITFLLILWCGTSKDILFIGNMYGNLFFFAYPVHRLNLSYRFHQAKGNHFDTEYSVRLQNEWTC